jgi:hypothetical protein
MTNFIVKWGNLPDNLQSAIQKSLQQSVLLVQWKAITNAPYLTGNLRRSITTEVRQDEWTIGTNVKYAKIREYVNKKNPSRRLYMTRAMQTSKEQIKMYFKKNISDLWYK